MDAKKYRLKYASSKFEIEEEIVFDNLFFEAGEDSDNNFTEVLEGYDYSEYPEV